MRLIVQAREREEGRGGREKERRRGSERGEREKEGYTYDQGGGEECGHFVSLPLSWMMTALIV